MFFMKHLTNKSKKDITTTETPALSNDVKLIESPVTDETNPNSDSSEDSWQNEYLLGSSILFNKFKRQNSGPDVLFDNESWAPENEYVGLFRKRRAQVEEQTTPTSDSE